MLLQISVLGWRLRLEARRMVKVMGVTSLLPDGNHILMWDFDNVDGRVICAVLRQVQWKYALPSIYVTQTSERNYHAYCFASKSWAAARHIVETTRLVDEAWVRVSAYRGYFTLRWSTKGRAERPRHYAHLAVPRLFGVNPVDLMSHAEYWTEER